MLQQVTADEDADRATPDIPALLIPQPPTDHNHRREHRPNTRHQNDALLLMAGSLTWSAPESRPPRRA